MIEPEINEQLGSFAPSQRNADLLQNVVSQESLSMTETITPRRSFVLPTAPSQPQLDPALKAAVDEMANQRSAVLNSSLYNATKKNPDAVAEAQRVAKQMGVGADIAERNLPELQRGAMMLKALDRNLAVSAPKTANSLTEPDFANIAYDDLENLTGTEKLMRWFAGTDFFKGAQGTFISTEMATIDQLNSEGMATSKDFERYKELQRDLQIVGQPAPYSISGNIANLLASVEAGAEIGAQYAVTGAVLGGAAGAIGGPLAPATMPAGMALGGTAGFATGMAKWMYQAMAGESYRQLREGDVSHEVALPMSRGIGVITSALEFAGLGAEVYIASGLGKKIFSKELATDVTSELSKQMIKKATASEAVWDASKLYFGEILTESTVEGLQTAITRVGTEIGRAYDRSDLQNMFQTPEGRRAIISEAVDSFVNVAIGMSVAGLPLPAANYYMDRGRYADAKRSQQFYEDLSKNAVDSKMRQRNPDAAERFYADQVDGTGAETTYVDGRVMQNILNQSGLTNEQVDTVLPGIRQQLAEAISIGGDVTISTATYAARLAGTKLGDSMKIHMRPNADAWSADTAVKYAGQLEQEKEKALALLEEKETTDTAFVNEARVIEKDMQEKLAAVGRDPKLAKAEATIFRDMMVVAAAEAKMTPAAYMAQHGPDVVGPQAQVAPLEQAEQFDQAGNRKTTTPEWNKWFGKSKVVDKANKPIVLYRGEDEKYPSPKIMFSGGIFLTTDKSLAKNYGPYVMEVFASIEKPLDVSEAKTITLAQWKNYLKKQGVDVSKLKFDSSLGKRYGDYGVDTLAGGADQEGGVIRYNFYELLGENDSWFGDGNLQQELQRQGFDGVKSQPESDLKEGENRSDVWIVWEGNQLKDVNNLRPSRGRESIYEQASRIDADYMAAVERGDMETAQRMVDKAASSARIPWSGVVNLLDNKIEKTFTRKQASDADWNHSFLISASQSDAMDDGTAEYFWIENDGSINSWPMAGRLNLSASTVAAIKKQLGNRIKSHDPITRDAAGNVIPLSRRFNIASPSILEQAAISNAGPIEAAKQLVEDAGRESFNDIESFFAEKWPALLSATGKQLDLNEANFQEAAKRGISDLSKFIADNPKFADYYKKDWELTRNVLSDFYGRQITDDEFVMFRTIAGLTSPNTTLPLNISDTVNFFDWWTKNGNFDAVKLGPKPETGTLVLLEKPFSISGTTGNIKARSIKVVEELVKRFGNAVDAIEFLREMVPVGELHKFNKEMGYAGSVSNIGNIRSLVKQATGQDLLIPRMFIFGQKVGAYTLNAVGDSRYTTVDIWESRFIRSYFTGMFAKNTGLPVDSIEHDVFTRFNEVFKEEFEKETGKSWEPSALQAMRWFYIIDAAKQSGYSRASTNETISFYTERKLQKSYGYGGYGIVDSQGRSTGDGASSAGIEGQQILQQSAVVSATTYSALDKAVGEVTAKSLAAAGWKEQIKGWVNKGIVKQSEVEWSGLVEYLDMQEGKITKETVSEFLKNNGVKVETVTLGDRGDLVDAATLKGIDKAEKDLTNLYKDDPTLKQEFDTYRKLIQENAPRDEIYAARFVIEERLQYPDTYSTLDTYIEEAYDSDPSDTSKYSMYVLPGGKNYREVLVKLPVGFAPPAPAMSKEGLAARQVVFDKYAQRLAEIETEIKKYRGLEWADEEVSVVSKAINLLKSERDELETQRDAEANALYKIPSAPKTKPFMSSHWDESNVLVHLRMNDRTDADGKRVLFVEEVQSDWGQEGKKKGFPGGMSVAEVQQAAAADRKRFYSGKGDMSLADWTKLSERVMQWDKQEVSARQALPRAPFVETTDGWLNLGLKHVMLEAVNGGYDRVAFVDGDQNVTRYKEALTNAVDEVEIDRNDDGTYNYKAIKDGNNLKAENSVTAERIEELFGKSGGADLIEQADAFPDQINTIKSKDLKIGGEGMRKFYDDVLPAAMNKLLKKYGGEKLGQTKFAKSEGVKVKVKEISDSAVKLIRGDISIEEFRDETDLSVEDVSDSILEDVSTAIGDRSDRARIRQFANDFAQDIKQKLAGGKKMTQPSFDVTAAFIEKVSQGLPLFQAAPSPGPARGGYDPKRIQILLNSEADAFTFLHELMHWRMDKMIQSVNNGKASPQEIADLDIMIQSFKLGGESQQERLAIWNAMTFEEQRPHWEAIAYNFENYLFEGKAPSVEMQGVFDRMASFIKRVYVSIRDDLNKIYRREFGKDLPVLTDEVRGVMDRMLASEDQIKRKQAMMQMVPMFLTQEEATEQGMDEATYAAYQAMNKEAEDAAVTDLTKASLKQMQWLSGARSRVLKELQAKHDALRKEIRAEVKAEVDAEPIYAAMSILKTGEGRAKNGEMVKFDDKFKLNLESVKKMIPAEDVAKLGFGKYGMVAADGMDPDMAADMFGFSSGDELVLALLSAKPAKEEINARTDKRMMDENGDMNTPQSQEEAVQRALHNEARFRFNAVEVRWLSKATSPVRVFMDAAKLAAQQIIAGKVIRDLRPSEYQAAEAKAAREAADAHSKRRTAAQAAQAAATKERNAGLSGVAAGVPMSEVEAAAAAKGQEAAQKATERESERKARYGERTPEQVILRAKQIQLLQNQLAREAQDAKDEVSKGVKYLRNVLKAKNVQRMGADITDQVTNMLERFSLANISVKEAGKRLSLAKWIEGQLELGIVPDIDPKLLDESFRKPYQQMTVSEFRDLVSSIEQLEYLGKHENEIRLAGEKVQFVDARDAIVKSIQEEKKDGKKLNPRTATTKGGRALEGIRTFMAAHLKVAAIARIMDGGKDNGKVWSYFIRSANAAGDMETRMIGEATEKVMNILKPVKALGNMESGRVYFKSIDRSLNRGERFVIALNSGNEGNLQRMRDGEGWTMDQLAPVLESLSSTEWNAVQAIWNHFETYKPLVEAKERRLYGKAPNWIEVKPFAIKTSDGKTLNLEGGYYPIKYDPKASDAAEQFTDAETAKAQMKGAFTAATTRRSYVKNRAERVVGRPLMLTMTGVYSGLGEVIHDLSWHEWLISANRMMKDRGFSSAVNETYGPEIKRQMKDWIKDVAAGQGAADQGAANFATWMRRSISSARLGFNATSGVMQISGLANTWVRIDGTLVPKWTAIGVGAFIRHPKKMMEMIQEKSSMMRNLGRTQFRDLNEIRNTMQDKDGKWNAIHANAYIFCRVMQSMVNYPTWAGAYEKSLFEGNNEDTSIALADQAVIDSQGGGQLKDLASVERGGAWSKLFTVFYGYQNALFNSMATSVMTQKKSTAAAQLTLLVAVPAVYKYYVNQAIKAKRKDDDDNEEKGLAAFVAEESIQTMLSSMVGIRELSNLAKFDAKEVRDYSGPSGLAMFTDITNVYVQTSQYEWDAAYRRALLNLAGDLFGIPAVQINRTVDGIQLMIDKNNADLRAPIFGTRR